jgi:hypothetical protein
MPDINALFTFVQDGGVYALVKVLLLILMFIYVLFTFIVLNRVRALNRTIYLAAANASLTLQVLSIISFLLAVSLFVATLVIV